MASPDLTVLHRLIWFDDHEGLQAYLQDLESSSEGVQEETKRIDAKFRGMAPIHLAIQLGHEKCVKILCEHGADMLIATDLGFLPLQEATSIGDRDMMREILIKRHEQMRNYVYRRQSHLHKVISEDIEDFYLEMNWDFKSWVPFFSMLCPSDCYKIWKKGNKIRIDTSLIGFDKLHWIRGNVSFLFTIEADTSNFYLLDHDKKLWQHVRNFRDYTTEEVEKDLNLRLNQEIVAGRLDSQKPITFSRSRTLMGLGDEVVENVGSFRARVFNVENLEWVTRTRKEHLRDRPEGDLSKNTSSWFLGYGGRTAYAQMQKDSLQKPEDSSTSSSVSENDSVETLYLDSMKEIEEALGSEINDSETVVAPDVSGIKDHLPDFDPHKIDGLLQDAGKLEDCFTPSLPSPKIRPQVPFEEYFPPIGAESDLPYIHLGRALSAKEQRKHLSASIWMSSDFPLTVAQLLPLFEILSPSNEHFDKLREFISMKLPPGFPVQVEIPVLMFLSARITFRNFKSWNKNTRKTIPIPAAVDHEQSSKNWFEVPEDYSEGIVIKSIIKKE